MSRTTHFRLSRGPVICEPRPSEFSAVKLFLQESENLYPGIDRWWEKKVVPTLKEGRRTVLVLKDASRISGLFIGKPGKHAKMCTLRLREKVRRRGWGTALMAVGINLLLDQDTQDIHLTVSEAVGTGCIAFFEGLGFRRIAVKSGKYIRGVDEFVYICPTSELEAIPHEKGLGCFANMHRGTHAEPVFPLGEDRTLLMSLKPEFADLCLKGKKQVEFRRRFSQKHVGATIVFYVSHPVRRFLFTAVIASIEHAKTKTLWSTYKDAGGIRRADFNRYFTGVEHGFAINLNNINPLPQQTSLDCARATCPEFRPPQSFKVLEADSPLLQLFRV